MSKKHKQKSSIPLVPFGIWGIGILFGYLGYILTKDYELPYVIGGILCVNFLTIPLGIFVWKSQKEK